MSKVRLFHHQRPLVAFAAAYGAGVWAGVRLEWTPLLVLAALFFGIFMAVLLKKRGKRAIVGWICTAVCLGYLLSGLAAHPDLPQAGRYRVTGILSQDMSVREDGKVAGYLEQVFIESEAYQGKIDSVYWTYVPESEAPFLPLEGQQVSFIATLYHPDGQDNPFGMDFRLFLLQKGVDAGVSGAQEAAVIASPSRGIASVFYQARKALSRQVELIFGEHSALPQALLVGVKENLPEETRRNFSDAGVAHILSVSGLHIALLAGVMMRPLQSVLSPGKRFLVLCIFLLGYCALLDFAAPVTRAALLMVFVQIRRIVRRAPDSLTTLSAAFLFLLIFRPLDLFSASFQLSFSAVLGIVLFIDRAKKRLAFLRFPFLAESFGATAAATLGTAIPTVQLFNRISLIGFLLNPLVCFAFSWLLPAYALITVMGCIYLPLGQCLAAPANFLADMLMQGVEWAAALPFATVSVPSLPFYVIGALIFAALMATRYIVWPGKRKLMAGVAALCAAFLIWPLSICRDVQYIQLEQGQADSALVLDGRETWILDVGEHGGDLASYLKATGRQADHVLISHLHSDHCLGLRELMDEEIKIGRIYLPYGAFEQKAAAECLDVMERARNAGIPFTFLSAGDVLESERTRITVTWPEKEAVKPLHDPNRFSMALLWELDGIRLFAAGDLEGTYEHYAAVDADVLKVAHHGSKGSTGQRFLSVVTPQIALVTAREGSSTLPHPQVKERLAEMGVSVYNIGDTGALTIRIKDGQASLTTFHPLKEGP